MYSYYSDCVSWPDEVCLVGGLCSMVEDGIEITRKTFLSHIIGHQAFKEMIQDSYTTFYRSKLYGRRVYYFCHSAIEYVFTN